MERLFAFAFLLTPQCRLGDGLLHDGRQVDHAAAQAVQLLTTIAEASPRSSPSSASWTPG
jgi:hypothetical protein